MLRCVSEHSFLSTRKDENGVGVGTGGTPALQPDPAASRRGRGAEAAMGSCRELRGAAGVMAGTRRRWDQAPIAASCRM